jgi:hypothetical protein
VRDYPRPVDSRLPARSPPTNSSKCLATVFEVAARKPDAA